MVKSGGTSAGHWPTAQAQSTKTICAATATRAILAEAAPLLKKYMDSFGRVQPYFDAKPGDPVERFVAEAEKHPVFEVVSA
jgi:hypothetical protein